MRRFFILLLAIAGHGVFSAQEPVAQDIRPNVLWLTSEDNGPHLGAYGDSYADTPHLDRLAAGGLTYRVAWSNAPVCAPARTAIITGMYPTSIGAQHMRSRVRLPDGMKMFPQILREAGYYTTNNAKEDYNVEKTGKVWDESSRKAHWQNRPEGAPFFAVFNCTKTHEGQIRKRPHEAVHDPAKVRVPAYHPDTPEVRQDWAQYYDKLTEMDAWVGERLAELEEAGLAEDTIVFYFGDHGPGMPRCKRWPYDSGLHVPMLLRVPERFRELASEEYSVGGTTNRPVSFVDLAPTVLSLAGIEPPSTMQGRAFLGTYEAASREYVFGFRDRMDERYDLVRSVRDERYVYIRNYMPHRIYGQHLAYMFQTPTTRVWKEMYDAGELTPPRTFFWEPKPREELYDLVSDPDEVHNLAGDPALGNTLERLRSECLSHSWRSRDLGFLPEAEIHSRSEGFTPYELGHRLSVSFRARIASMAHRVRLASRNHLAGYLDDADSAIRYWAAVECLARGEAGTSVPHDELRHSLADVSASVRIAVAEALARFGDDADLEPALDVLLACASLEDHDVYTVMLALNALDHLDDRAGRVVAEIEALPREDPDVPKKLGNYVPRLLDEILAGLRPEPETPEAVDDRLPAP